MNFCELAMEIVPPLCVCVSVCHSVFFSFFGGVFIIRGLLFFFFNSHIICIYIFFNIYIVTISINFAIGQFEILQLVHIYNLLSKVKSFLQLSHKFIVYVFLCQFAGSLCFFFSLWPTWDLFTYELVGNFSLFNRVFHYLFIYLIFFSCFTLLSHIFSFAYFFFFIIYLLKNKLMK